MNTQVAGLSAPERPPGAWRRVWRRLASSQTDIDAHDLQRDVDKVGCCPIREAGSREYVELAGRLRHVTLRPRSGTPALEAELYDGSGCVTVVWLGRRRIAGIEPGRHIKVEGRLGSRDGRPVMYNPRYELRA